MKFQNPSLNSVLNGRKDERTNERTNEQMNEHTSRNQYAPHFFKVGGIKSNFCSLCMLTIYAEIIFSDMFCFTHQIIKA